MNKQAKEQHSQIDSTVINEVQLLLAEKRTSLAVLRTGIAVLALPMSVISLLIATSKYYDVFEVMHFFVPLGILNLALIILGTYLIIRSTLKMWKYDRHIKQIKRRHRAISEFIE